MDDIYLVKKIAKTIKLTGVLEDGSTANSRQSKNVVCFVTPDRKYKLTPLRPGSYDILQLSGPGIDGTDGFFRKDSKYGYYTGSVHNIQVNIAVNKISAEMRVITYVPGPYSLSLKLDQKYKQSDYKSRTNTRSRRIIPA